MTEGIPQEDDDDSALPERNRKGEPPHGNPLDDSFVPAPELPLESSSELFNTGQWIDKARGGDSRAMERLFARYNDPLIRFIRVRMSAIVRKHCEPTDIAQFALTKAFKALGKFEYRGVGSYWRWLRHIAHNAIIEEHRKYQHRPDEEVLPESSHSGPMASVENPAAGALRKEQIESFERALEKLDEHHRGALLLRLEMGLDYASIAQDCKFPSADAARMAISRAMKQVAKDMGHEGSASKS